MSAAPFVDVKNLRRVFDVSKPWLNRVLEGGHLEFLKAVDGVTFDIRKGETFALVGESGSGKTTVARMVVGLLPPSSGGVIIDGVSMTDARHSQTRQRLRRRIQMIFQDPYASLNPRFRVDAIVSEPLRAFDLIQGERDIRTRVGELLSVVGLHPDDGLKYPHEFSGGQRQRIAIARALASEAEVIVCDEPTSALDVSVQAQIISLIKRLGRDHGTAVMLVTHDMGVIAETSDRVAVMYSGRIAEIGPVRDVVQNPLHPYARGLMGAIPTLAGEDKRLVQIPGSMPRLSAIPKGCPFNPRCGSVFDRCRVERPEPQRQGAQQVACHLYDPSAKESAKDSAA